MDDNWVRSALYAGAMALCLYLPFVALDLVRRARTKRHASPWGWLLGGAAAWGTSLSAALLLTLLGRHGALDLSHDGALMLASWLVSVGTAFGVFAAVSIALPGWRGWLRISAGLALGVLVSSSLLLVSLQPVNAWAPLWSQSWLLNLTLVGASLLLVAYLLASEGLLQWPERRARWAGPAGGIALAAFMCISAPSSSESTSSSCCAK